MLERVNMAKVLDLMKIKGSCDQIRAQLRERKNLLFRKRFEEAIDYFSRIEEVLKLFNKRREHLLETNIAFLNAGQVRKLN